MDKSEYKTLEFEIGRMEEVTKKKLETFRPARHCSIEDEIFHIFKSSSKAHITTVEVAKIYKVIEYYLRKKTPIKVSFLWAMYWMVQSPWKFIDYNVIKPRLGDYWAPYWFSLLNNKLKKIFPPGCEFDIIEEFEMVKEMGWTKNQSLERASLLRPVYAKFDCIKIFDLPIFTELPNVIEPNSEEIASTIVATPRLFNLIPDEKMRAIMDTFYHANDTTCSQAVFQSGNLPHTLETSRILLECRKKSADEIKKIVPYDLWEQGKNIKRRMNQIAKARRSSNWLNQTVMSGEPFIDAAIIKRGAWSPDIWAFTSPQHGGSVLDLGNRLYSISIAAEYRLKESGEYKPIMMRDGDEEFIFYWLPSQN